MTRKTYTARAVRSDRWWTITIDGLKGAHSQSRTLAKVEPMAREVIVLMTDEAEDRFDVDVQPEISSEIEERQESNRLAHLDLEQARAAAAATATALACSLVEAGLTLRDAGRVMGLSFQRVEQLVKEKSRSRTSA